MYPASSRHRDRRPRSARQASRHRRPLLEALEPRQLFAASTEVSWVKVSAPGLAAATNGSEMYTTNGSWLTMYVGLQEMATVRASGSVTAATDGHAYTSDVAKYGLSGGLHLEWSHAGYFPNVSDVDAADDGSVYIVGTYRTAFDADPGPDTHMLADPIVFGRNAYIAKLDADGNFLWASTVGGDEGSGHASLDQYNAVQLDVDPAGNAYVAVNYVTGLRPPFEGGGAVLMKFAASGQGGWREAIGDFRSAVTRLAASPDGSGVAVAISGPTLTAEDLAPVASTSSVEHYPSSGGTPPKNSFIARYDAAGALAWARQPEINSDPRNVGPATALDISPRGDVLVAAGASDGVASFALVQRYDSLGNLLSRQAYDGLVITSIADSDSQIHLNITGTFSGTVDIDPGYSTHEITVPAGATSAGVLFRLIDPSGGSERLLGTPIGTPGSWNSSGNDFTKALDNNYSSYFDAPTSQAYVGYDFGRATIIDHAEYIPRTGYEFRMVGGQFQGSNDGSNWITVATITATPKTGTTNYLAFAAPVTYRYMRYLSPADGFGNAAEISFNGAGPEAYPPDVPLHPTTSWDGTRVWVNWTDLATNETGYRAELFANPEFTGAPLATAERGSDFHSLYFSDFNTPGIYYVRALAYNSYNRSFWASAGSVTIPGTPATGQLTGTPIGTPGSYNNEGNDLTKAFDGNISTFFDAPIGDAWVGLDLGTATALDRVRFFPRAGLAWRMVDGTFQGSNDGVTWATLATISSEPAEGTYTTMSLSGTYRYVRYQGAAWGSGNVAELQFYGTGTQPPPPSLPAAPTGLTVSGGLNKLTVTWADNATNETGYIVDYSPSPDFVPGTPGSGSSILPANATSDTRLINPGTVYYVRVRATNSAGASANATSGPVTTTAVRLTGGTPIGTPGSWNNSGNDITKAFDGATSSYFDAPTSQAYVGLDFGVPTAVSSVTFYPRVGQEARMLGGTFRVSDDGVNWTNVGGIGFVPQANVPFTLNFANPVPHRYVSYLSPDGGWGNVAELQFYGQPATTSPIPATPSNVTGGLVVHTGHVSLSLAWTDNSSNETGFNYQISTSPDFSTIFSQLTITSATALVLQDPPPGTYYFRVRAVNDAGASPFAVAPALTVPAGPPLDPTRLFGTEIGTGAPYGWPTVYSKALDGNVSTYFDSPSSQAYAGYNLGSPAALTSVRFYPRQGFASRMVGGVIQGSTDSTNWTTLATITATPAEGQYTTLPISDPRTFPYVRYLSPDGGYGNVAELEFYGRSTTAPLAPTDVAGVASDTSTIRVTWTNAIHGTRASTEVQISTTPDFSAGVVSRTAGALDSVLVLTPLGDGTYYIRVRALGGTYPNSEWAYAADTVTLGPPVVGTQLAGTVIGTPGSWNDSGNDRTKVFDGNTSTFFDAPVGDAWVGLDLGTARPIDYVRFFPRAGLAWRMVDGMFQGSNDGTTWTTLAKITSEPAEGTFSLMNLGGGSYRYVRYQGAAWGSGNVAELQFYTAGGPAAPAAPTGVVGTLVDDGTLHYAWADVAGETSYQYQYSTSPGFETTLFAGTLSANTRGADLGHPAPGTYYFRVRAVNAVGASAYTNAAPVNIPVNPTRLSGSRIGTAGSWNNSGNTFDKALDDNPNTFFDAPTSQAYVGLRLDALFVVTSVRLTPRAGYAWRVPGGRIQTSSDGTNWTTVLTITATPPDGTATTYTLPAGTQARFVRYLSPEDGFGNVADLQFYGYPAATP